MQMQTINPDHTQFYVSAMDGPRRCILAGPWGTVGEAKDSVPAVEEFLRREGVQFGKACVGVASSYMIRDTVLGSDMGAL